MTLLAEETDTLKAAKEFDGKSFSQGRVLSSDKLASQKEVSLF